MENITLEKVITFSTCIEKLENINFEDSLDYKLNDDGISAYGIIKLHGKIKTIKGYEDFNDTIDVDIFAPFEQIIEKDKFTLKIEKIDHQIIRNNLILKITLSINGFKRIEEVENKTSDDINMTNEIENLEEDNNYEKLLEDYQNIEEKEEAEETIIDNEKNIEEDDLVKIITEETHDICTPIDNNRIKEKNVIEENIDENWANNLFTLNNSYVSFYRIHRKIDDEDTGDSKFELIKNQEQ